MKLDRRYLEGGLCKPQIESNEGVVVSKHPLVSEIGHKVLQDGGNAMDAIIAMAFATGVAEPYMSGLGGIGLGVLYDKNDVHVFTGLPRAPLHLPPELYKVTSDPKDPLATAKVDHDANLHGPLAIATPGSLALLWRIWQHGASMPWQDLLRPSILLAEEGIDVDWNHVLNIAADQRKLSLYPETARIFLPDGFVPSADMNGTGADRILQSDLADSLQIIGKEGASAFYEGNLGSRFLQHLQQMGGILSQEDLNTYAAEEVEPGHLQLWGYDIWYAPGFTGGPTLVAMLDGYKEAGISRYPWGSDKHLQIVASVSRKAMLERITGQSQEESTTHLAVIDQNGQAVSLTLTLLSRFGSRIVVPQTGILCNNGMMWFDPRPDRINSIAPGAIPQVNMSPVLVTRDHQLVGVLGASGGRKIMGGLAQVLLNLLLYEMPIDDAIAAPRLDVSGRVMYVDPRLGSSRAEVLSETTEILFGTKAQFPGVNAYTSPVGIWKTKNGYQAGVDPFTIASAR